MVYVWLFLSWYVWKNCLLSFFITHHNNVIKLSSILVPYEPYNLFAIFVCSEFTSPVSEFY